MPKKRPLTAEEKAYKVRQLNGQIGALKRIADPAYDGRKATEAATKGRQAALERAVNPDGALDPSNPADYAVIRQKAAALRKAQLAAGRLRRLQRTPVQKGGA